MKSLTQRLLSIKETVSALVSEAKRLEKKATKVQKLADKRRGRKAKVEGDENKPKKPSVFNTPTDISPALCSFLGRPAGSQESRSNVTRQINEYIKSHNLKPKGTHTLPERALPEEIRTYCVRFGLIRLANFSLRAQEDCSRNCLSLRGKI